MKRLISFLLVSLVLCVPVFADYSSMSDLLEDVNEFIPPAISTPEPSDQPVADDQISDLPVSVMALDEAAALAAATGVYPGSISSTVLDYFSGVMLQNPGVPYVVYRADRYLYYLYFGEGISYSNGVFSGSGKYVCYDSESSYTISRGEGSVNVNGSSGFVYTNLAEDYAALSAEQEALGSKSIFFGLCVLLGLCIFFRIFFRSR